MRMPRFALIPVVLSRSLLLIAIRPENPPFADFYFTSEVPARYPCPWLPPSAPKSRSSLPVYTSQAHERSNFPHRRHRMLHVMPASLLLSTASAYFPSPRGCTSKPLPTTDFQALRRTNSFVCTGLPPLCPLFPLFSALAPFVFNRLQPLFPKHPGGGYRCGAVCIVNLNVPVTVTASPICYRLARRHPIRSGESFVSAGAHIRLCGWRKPLFSTSGLLGCCFVRGNGRGFS
jgi:hypothetical protein